MSTVQESSNMSEDEEMEEDSDDEGSDEDEDAEVFDSPDGQQQNVDMIANSSDAHADGNNTASPPPPTSPTRSRAPSPTESLIEHTSSLQISTPLVSNGETQNPDDQSEDEDESRQQGLHPDVKDRVASDLTKQRARQARYHSKRGTRKIGRPKGSKAKQDTRVKVDNSGFWD